MLIPYFIYVSYPRKEIDPMDPYDTWEVSEESPVKIKNGHSVTFSIREETCAIVVWAITSTGAAGGPAFYLEEGSSDVALEVITQYSFWDGSRYLLRPAENSEKTKR